LPDRDYYLKNDPRSVKIRTEYTSFIKDLFKLTGVDDATAAQNASAILELETKLANAQLSRVEMRDPQKLYNKFFVDDFSKTTTTVNWRNIMAKMLVTNSR
jgi:putative endopeptidase